MSMHDYDDYISRTQPKLGGIVFICNNVVRSACRNKCTHWRHGDARISYWQYGRDFWLWATPKLKYRIAFVVDEEGILPLQPCVEISKEKSATISACSWCMEPSALLEGEDVLVSLILEREIGQAELVRSAF